MMLKRKLWTIGLAVGLLCMVGSVNADIIVQADQMDSSDWLEVITSGSETATLSDLADVAITDIDDGLWCLRRDYITVVGYDAFHSKGANDNSPEMTILASGLGANTPYEVYARYFVYTGSDGAAYTSLVGLTSGNLNTYNANTTDATVLAIRPTHAGFQLWESLVGTATTDANGDLAVYFDDNGTNEGTFNGIRLVEVPEPATIALLFAGGLFGLIRRRSR